MEAMVPKSRPPRVCLVCGGAWVCPHAVTVLRRSVPIRANPKRRCCKLCMAVFLLVLESPLIAQSVCGKVPRSGSDGYTLGTERLHAFGRDGGLRGSTLKPEDRYRGRRIPRTPTGVRDRCVYRVRAALVWRRQSSATTKA